MTIATDKNKLPQESNVCFESPSATLTSIPLKRKISDGVSIKRDAKKYKLCSRVGECDISMDFSDISPISVDTVEDQYQHSYSEKACAEPTGKSKVLSDEKAPPAEDKLAFSSSEDFSCGTNEDVSMDEDNEMLGSQVTKVEELDWQDVPRDEEDEGDKENQPPINEFGQKQRFGLTRLTRSKDNGELANTERRKDRWSCVVM